MSCMCLSGFLYCFESLSCLFQGVLNLLFFVTWCHDAEYDYFLLLLNDSCDNYYYAVYYVGIPIMANMAVNIMMHMIMHTMMRMMMHTMMHNTIHVMMHMLMRTKMHHRHHLNHHCAP